MDLYIALGFSQPFNVSHHHLSQRLKEDKMKKLIISFTLIVLFCLSVQAQGLYRVTFDTNNVAYDGLLVWYGSGQPFMRVRYYHPNLKQYVVIQQNLTYVNMGFLGEQLRGSNVVFITPVPSGYGYSPDHFVFQRLPNGFYACTGTIDDQNLVGTVREFRPLQPYEATNTLFQNFGFSPPNNASTTNSSNATMHMIVVADIEDSKIGTASVVDATSIIKEFEIAAKEIGIAFRPTLLARDGFSKTSVTTTLQNLQPGSNDIVVFVYTGHGFRFKADTDAFPRFSLTRNRQSVYDNNLSAAEVYHLLKKKGARLNITIADSCNNEIDSSKSNHDEGVVLKPSDAGISRRAVATLFLNTSGNLIVAAASKGEYALSNSRIGGFFIHSFLDAFMYETSITNGVSPRWDTILSKAKNYAYSKTGGRQTAVFYTDLR